MFCQATKIYNKRQCGGFNKVQIEGFTYSFGRPIVI
jgi:hypothetical protein